MNCRKRYDWAAVQRFYDGGHSMYRCMEKFGFCSASWTKAVRRGEIKPRPVISTEDMLRRGSNRHNIKTRLLADGLLEHRCSRCGIREHNGKPLSIQLDHINGVNNDYRLENLRMLCPNCHSLTETYGRRNVRRRPHGINDQRR